MSKGREKKGFAALLAVILVLVVMLAIGISLTVLSLGEYRISRNTIKSSQAYYSAEAGIEDALLRLKKKMDWSSSYTLKVGEGSAVTTISDIIGGSRTITSEGDVSNRIRKVQVVYEISSQETSFYYGAQVGKGGIQMENKAKIEGNVFSNGSIIGTSKQEITGSVIVATNGNKIEQLDIGGDAKVYTCENSEIEGGLTYVSGGKVINCNVAGSIESQPDEIPPKDLPISESTIDQWKKDAESGGTIGDYTLSGNQEGALGPKKIEGRLTVQNNAKLKVTGTIWVTGEIVIKNNSQVFLDKDSYGSKSGVIISDSKITVQNETRIFGSGEEGSYLMLLSTFSGDPAILIQNSPELDIIYASQGRIELQNNIRLRQVSGWGLRLKNNAQVIYEVGLEDVSFSSGPGGGWKVVSWKEVE